MKVRIPSPLRSYTKGAASVEAAGETLLAVLADLDARYPGIRFRMIDEQDGIRQHIKIFVNTEPAHKLQIPLRQDDVVHIIAALSGG
ncbi:MAG TPA: MoaD/ThiS family protein [Candidatus Obscuribacterales bacterium]